MSDPKGTKKYFAVFGWLAALTVLEILSAASPISRIALILVLVATALSKALLIVLYFMHLRFESPLVWILPAVPVALAIFFVLMLFPDVVYHLAAVFVPTP